MAESGILEVCNFLRSKNILIPSQNQWLKGCIACFRESTANSTINQLKEFAFDQWKLADLKDIKAPCLPSNCKTAQNLILPGKYAVQINYAVNISESFYKQLQKIRRPAAEDNLSVDTDKDKDKNEPQGNRTLKMEITDGVVTLLGFEDKQIRKLVEPFIPGVKAVLTGPIECRKGVLFLKNENIDLIGGEVDDLLIVNAVENVLARELKQPENPDPYKTRISVETEQLLQDDDDFIVPDIENIERNVVSNQNRGLSNQDRTVSSTLNSQNTISTSFERNETSNQNRSSGYQVTTSRKLSSTENSRQYSTMTTVSCTSQLDESFDLDDDEEFILMAAQTAQIAEQTTQPTINKNSTNRSANNERNVYENKNEHKRKPSTEGKAHASQSTLNNYFSSKPGKNADKISDKYKCSVSDNESFRAELEESLRTELEELKNEKPKKCPEVPKLTFPPKKYPSTMVVSCCINSISEKLTLYDNKWSLSAMVRIKGVEMEVDFSPESLDKLIGMSPLELQEKRKEVRENPKLKDKLNDILKSSQKRILELDCDMKIHFTSYIAKPVILKVYKDF